MKYMVFLIRGERVQERIKGGIYKSFTGQKTVICTIFWKKSRAKVTENCCPKEVQLDKPNTRATEQLFRNFY